MSEPLADSEPRIERLHAPGVIDMHYDLLMDLYMKRAQTGVLQRDYLAEMRAGGIGVVGVAIYVEDHYLPEMALRTALGQIALLHAEVDRCPEFAICRSYAQIEAARRADKIALLITMEGVEPLGSDLLLLRAFYELGVRMVGLTHARRNAAGDGGIFAPQGSSPQGLTAFGREVVQACESLGIIVDLAHINPAGFDDILALTHKPLVVSHSNARRFYDIERNLSDAQIKAVGERGGVIGVNAALVSATPDETHLDRYIDHIEYMVELAGIDAVGIGFDFFERIWNSLPPPVQAALTARLTEVRFIPELRHHGHARNLTRKLLARGFSESDIEKILYRNWQRVLAQTLL